MKLPLNWLKKYIEIEHTPEEFGNIMTKLEFMQDGAIEEIGDNLVIDLEVRQNRPDSFSIIGLAREYAAYIGKKITEPESLDLINISKNDPSELLNITSKNLVKRFYAVKIEKIKVKPSPEWMKSELEAYGIPSINNIVDITNYVMLEYGMPLHAFDLDKLSKNKEGGLLEIRKARQGENINTWQGTQINLETKDLIISSGDKPVAIAGITGGDNSGIDKNTKNIILESACYDQATVRKTSLNQKLRTDSSTRHEKFLNAEMVEKAIKRALFLIQELCEGEITLIEDYYEQKPEAKIIEFNLYEIQRVGGVQIDNSRVAELLTLLGFEIIDQKEAIGLNQNVLVVKVPIWRTDVNIQADVLEEVLRLWGYENIPLQPIKEAPQDYSTTKSIQLEEKIKDILVSFGLDEYISNPLVKKNDEDKLQIELENPLNQDKNALRTNIQNSLIIPLEQNKKIGREKIGLFESGKIYKKLKKADYKEEKCISTLYYGYDFIEKIKPDFIALINKLGLYEYDLEISEDTKENQLKYYKNGELLFVLKANGYDLFIEKIVNYINLQDIPLLSILKNIPQRSYQEASFTITPSVDISRLVESIYKADKYIKSVKTLEKYVPEGSKDGDYSLNLEFIIEDPENTLTGEDINKIREKVIQSTERTGARLR